MEILPSSTTNLGEGELNTPDLTLVAETVFADNLQLGVAGRWVRTMALSGDKLALIGQENAYRRADSKGRRGTL